MTCCFLQEGDEVWEPEQLFTDVASELNSEREKAEAGGEPAEPDRIDPNQPPPP